MKRILFLLIIVIINSCGISHNIPSNQTPNEILKPNTIKIFVDQNGNYYPNDWEAKYGEHPKNARRYAYSLNTIAKEKNLKSDLDFSENEILDFVKKETENKSKIFILVHGYNNSEEDANESFKKIKDLITDDINNTAYVEFYWDGLVSNRVSGSMKIWFNATGYSQLAGEYGLRKILNTFNNKEIIIISHSRGASVVLSAFSNPPYNPNFAMETKKNHDISVGNKIPLAENNNKIKCILLAPAVGELDFQNENRNSFRSFSNQIEDIQITINSTDPSLNKYVGFADKFNPTNLGCSKTVFNKLVNEYKYLSYTDYTGMKSHSFKRYIEDKKFIEMLQKIQVKTIRN